jgi:ABC-type ATPase with predicted acetyltransferase domain
MIKIIKFGFGVWKCSNCGAWNSNKNSECKECGASR